jgi:hypothetical protein
MDSFEKMLWSGGLGILSTLIGQMLYNKLVVSSKKLQEVKVDAYTVISFLFYLLMYYFDNQQVWTLALPGLLIAATVWLQRNRVPAKFSVFVVILSGVYLLQPYYSVIGKLNVPAIWEREVLVLPWIALVVFIRLKFKGMYTKVTKPLEWGVLLVVSMLLIQDGLVSSNIYDAIILGTLALISMLSGMYWQTKSYFFIGCGVLLLNVFLQTRPYWGNMPWWCYLLIVGFILIIVASFNEWNKQKILNGEATFLTSLKNKVINKMKQWN